MNSYLYVKMKIAEEDSTFLFPESGTFGYAKPFVLILATGFSSDSSRIEEVRTTMRRSDGSIQGRFGRPV
jgi:hypothetical protein